jgi:hypothetical protein
MVHFKRTTIASWWRRTSPGIRVRWYPTKYQLNYIRVQQVWYLENLTITQIQLQGPDIEHPQGFFS